MDENHLKEIQRIDQEILNKRKSRGLIWNTIKTLRGNEKLSDFITFESIPLFPLLSKIEGKYLLTILLSTVDDNEKLNKPWGWASISIPELEIKGRGYFNNQEVDVKPSVTKKLICSKKFANLLQQSIDQDSKIPLPPENLLPYFSLIGEKNRKKSKPDDYPDHAKNVGPDDINNQHIEVDPSIDKTVKIKNALHDILRDYGDKELLEKFYRINKKITQPHFSIGIVGEFNRGKSTFVNNLLSEDIIPVGTLPTSALVTKIINGSSEKLYLITENKQTQIPLEKWSDFIADGQGEDPEGALVLEFPSEFLQKSGIKIIDTPGVGDLVGSRHQITTQVIASCDATLITIDATMPISLTEKSFIEEHILLNKIPRIAIIITKMDQIAKQERKSVFYHIRDIAENLSKNISVWIANDNIDPFSEEVVIGIKEIKKKLMKWSQSPKAKKIRYQQIQMQYFNLSKLLSSIIKNEIELLTSNAGNIEKQVKNEKNRIKKEARYWRDFELELKSGAVEFTSWIREQIRPYEDDIIKKFQLMVKSTGNKKEWFEEHFPYYLKKELIQLLLGMESTVKNKIQKEIVAVVQQMQDRYSEESQKFGLGELSFKTEVEGIFGQVLQEVDEKNLNDLNKARKYTSYGLNISGVALFLINPVIGITTRTGGDIISQYFFKKIEFSQEEKVLDLVAEVIGEIFNEIPQILKEQVEKIYDTFISGIREKAQIWTRKQTEALYKLENQDNEQDSEYYSALLKRINDLAKLIKMN